MKIFPIVAASGLVILGCTATSSTPNRGNMTLGATQLKLEIGKTTKAQVLEWFGSPNIATRDKEGEVWNYTRQGTTAQIKSTSVGAWFLLGTAEHSHSSAASGSYSFDLLIRFDKSDIVIDYKVLQTAF